MVDLNRYIADIDAKLAELEAEAQTKSESKPEQDDLSTMNPNELAKYYFENYIKTKDKDLLEQFLNCLNDGKVKSIYANVASNVNDISIFFEKVSDNKTVLEYIFENKISFSYDIKNIILNNIELLKVCFKYKRYEMLSYVTDKVMLQQIDGMTVLEYLFVNRLIEADYLKNLMTPLAIELCVKYKRYDLLPNLCEQLLFSNISENKKVIEYLFENNMVDKTVVGKFFINKDIVQLCKKYNRLDLLKELNESILIRRVSEETNITILEQLLNEGIEFNTTFSSVDTIKKIIGLKKFSSLKRLSLLTVTKEYEPGKTIFEELLDNNLLVERAIEELSYSSADTAKMIFNILVKRKRYDLLLNCGEPFYLEVIDGNKTLFEVLLENNMLPYSNNPSILLSNQNFAEMIVKYGKYEILNRFSFDTLIEISPSLGITYVEELIKRGYSFVKGRGTDEKLIVDLIFKYERYDLLNNVYLRALIKLANLNETYMDIILEKYKEGIKIDITQSGIPLSFNTEMTAKLYLIYAKHGLIEHLPKLDKGELLEEKNGVRLIDKLLEEDKDLTMKIIPDKVKEEFEIAMILRLNGLDQTNIKMDSVTRDFQSEYLQSFYGEYDTYELDPESEELLNQFKVLMSDGKSRPEFVEAMIRTYRHLIYTNSAHKVELMHWIKIKKTLPQFSLQKISSGAYYRPATRSIYLSDANIDTLNHEMGHVLFHNIAGKQYSKEEFMAICDKLEPSSEFLDKVKEYSIKYHEIRANVEKYVDDKYMKDYDKSITDEKRKEIEEFLSKSKEEKKKIYLAKGYKEELLDTIFDRTYSVDEYIEQDRRVTKNELVDLILRTQYSEFIAIGDYFDGIYKGKFRDDKLKDKEGKTIKHAYGHGLSYYASGITFVFDEMLANYSEIMKSKNPEKGIEMLRYYIGDEIVNFVSEYYNKQIVQTARLTHEEVAVL